MDNRNDSVNFCSEEGETHHSEQLPFEQQLDALKTDAWAIAESRQGKPLELLAVLRTLEEVHVQIRDALFQSSLPNNRQKLYALLRDIELEGGWPYIPRMKLKRLLANFEEELDCREG